MFKKILAVFVTMLLLLGAITGCSSSKKDEAKPVVQTVENGLSAYELAVQHGYEGTVQEWLESLKGKSAYQIAVENGYSGTETEWLASLKTKAENVVSIKDAKFNSKGELILTLSDETALNLGVAIGADGKDGQDGTNGTNGKDGVDGKDGKDGADGISITDVDVNDLGELALTFSDGKSVSLGKVVGSTGAQGAQGEKGDKGDAGDQGPQGEKGDAGATGAQGPQGEKGETGAAGAQGAQGEQGIGIKSIQINTANRTMTIVLTNDREFVFENIVGADGEDGISPQIRINASTNEWEISADKGVTWTSTGVKATGEKGDKGDTGAQGPQGEKGETGATGAQGEKGETGESGVSPLIRINTSTNLWEISTDNGLNWVSTNVPATGEKGETGASGAQGEQGEKGETGAQGEKGETGAEGNGITGITVNENNYLVISMKQGEPIIIERSIVESKGDKGDTGEQGIGIKAVRLTADYMLIITLTDNSELDPIGPIRGEKGETGAQGPQGEKGEKGETGAQGPQGEKGEKGETGAQGPQGEKGEKGETGASGLTPILSIDEEGNLYVKYGENGEPSLLASIKGPKGDKGEKGDPGKDGVDGAPGKDGVDGAPGKDGVDGEPGKDGVDGKTPYIKDGNWWIGDTDTGIKAEGQDGQDGAPGTDGVDGVPGKDGVDGTPGTDGVDGEKGDKGDKGDPGQDGAPGKDGVNVVDSYVDENLHLWIVLSDGTKIDAGYVGVTTTNPSTPTKFTVVFKDYDGDVLKTEEVEPGKSATAPADPSRDGYVFAGWDKAYTNITANLTVTAQYKVVSTKPTISVKDVEVSAGMTEASVVVSIKNNPGIMNMVLSMNVDDSVFAFKKATKGAALPSAVLTSPGSKVTSSPYNFLMDAMELTEDDKTDGELFTITFTIKDTMVTGDFDVNFSYVEGDIVDENFEAIDMDIENGKITIK